MEETIGRVLGFEPALPDEKLSSFVIRLKQQIDSTKLGIKTGDVNDKDKAKNYIRKVEEFLNIPFFKDRKNRDKRIHHLKDACKVVVGKDKAILEIYDEWFCLKRSHKVYSLSKYFPYPRTNDFSYGYEISEFYGRDVKFFSDKEELVMSEQILVDRLLALTSSSTVSGSEVFVLKGTWKVSTFIERLKNWIATNAPEALPQLEEVFSLPYLKQKKYLNLEVRELKNILKVRSEILSDVHDWVVRRYLDALKSLETSRREETNEKTIHDYVKAYDGFFDVHQEKRKAIEKEYKLYRFGQGLIEADIFDALYK